jgi:hypothetical protein
MPPPPLAARKGTTATPRAESEVTQLREDPADLGVGSDVDVLAVLTVTFSSTKRR